MVSTSGSSGMAQIEHGALMASRSQAAQRTPGPRARRNCIRVRRHEAKLAPDFDHPPATFMDQAMMEVANRDQVGHVG